MELFIYSLIVFCVSFIFQIILIFLIERKRRIKQKEIDLEKIYGNNMKIIVKILIAIIISVVLAIITFYIVGIACIGMLREGH